MGHDPIPLSVCIKRYFCESGKTKQSSGSYLAVCLPKSACKCAWHEILPEEIEECLIELGHLRQNPFSEQEFLVKVANKTMYRLLFGSLPVKSCSVSTGRFSQSGVFSLAVAHPPPICHLTGFHPKTPFNISFQKFWDKIHPPVTLWSSKALRQNIFTFNNFQGQVRFSLSYILFRKFLALYLLYSQHAIIVGPNTKQKTSSKKLAFITHILHTVK